MKITTAFLLLLNIFLASCAANRAQKEEIRRLQHDIDSLQAAVSGIQNETKTLDLELLKTDYDIQSLRNRVVAFERDSVIDYYENFVFRFKRPMVSYVEPDGSSPFLFPVKPEKENNWWKLNIVWGRLFYFDFNHLGMDIYVPEGDTVRAIYDGTIVHYDGGAGYGDLAVVIEHEYKENWKGLRLPPKFLSIYGHLRKQKIRDVGPALHFNHGDKVRKGTVIGFINDDDHNGDGGVHLHFGIRLQSADEAKASDAGKWFRGYDNRDGKRLRYFLNPIELYGRFIYHEFRDWGY